MCLSIACISRINPETTPMTFLPVVERELRIAARRRQTYWTRFFAALATLVLSTWIWGWVTDGHPAHERGQILFRVISCLAFGYSLLAGVGITADCLSEEKREGTLGLLFLTDLHGYDVVLGKLVATSLNAVYRLLSVFPILAIPLLLGAMTAGEFWRMILALLNTLLFSLAAGMLISSISRQERRALAGTLSLILLLTAGPPLVGLIVAIIKRSGSLDPAWLLTSAAYPGVLALETRYRAAQTMFWIATGLTHAFTWTFLILASLCVRRTWQDRPTNSTSTWWRDLWLSWQFGRPSHRLALRKHLLDTNPILWLSGRGRFRMIIGVATVLGLALLWAWLYIKFGSVVLDPSFYVLTSYTAHTLFKLWLASDVGRTLTEDRKSGALELLLSTPLSVREILHGHHLALVRQFAWPVMMVLFADLIMLVAGSSDQAMDGFNDWLFLCLGLMALFVADLYTLGWVGLWLSLTCKRSNRAVTGAVGRVLVLPWAIFVFALSLLAMVQWHNLEPDEVGLFVGAFGIAAVNDALWIAWAKKNLESHFRQVATERFAAGAEPATATAHGLEPALVPPLPTP